MKENHIFFEQFIESVSSGVHGGKKYCFIIGSGASVSSGVPTGNTLMNQWFSELKDGHTDVSFSAEINRRIEVLVDRESDIQKKEEVRNKLRKYSEFTYEASTKDSQEDYNNIYELRFADRPVEGREFFIELLKDKVPNVGYLELAKILSDSKSDVVITTNFDSLIEQAIRMIANKSPFTIGHEALAEYATDGISKLPKILKPHRDYLYGGFNRADEIEHLKEAWMSALKEVLKQYIPIVVGYSGTDPDMIELLSDCECETIYWCYRYGHSPRQELEDLVAKKNGVFVPIIDSDHVLASLTESFDLADKLTEFYRKKMKKDNLRFHMMDQPRNAFTAKHLSKLSMRQVKRIGEEIQKRLQDGFSQTTNSYIKQTYAPNFLIGNLFIIALVFDSATVMKGLLWLNQRKTGYYAKGYYELATCYFRKNNLEKAETEYLNFISSVPDGYKYLEAKAWNNLRAIYARRDDRKNYLIAAENYLKLEPADKKIWKEYEANL